MMPDCDAGYDRASHHGVTGQRSIAIVTDAWEPQVNGVVRSLKAVRNVLGERGLKVSVIEPNAFPTLALPGYSDIRLGLAAPGGVGRMLTALAPDHLHIATEGPLGWAARLWAKARGLRFTTAVHTRFADYLALRLPVGNQLARDGAAWAMRRFHAAAACTLVPTESLRAELAADGYRRLAIWGRGIDSQQFHPRHDMPEVLRHLPRPIFLSVGRLAVEKNLPAFLSLDLPGSRVIVGDGPLAGELRQRYPGACFLGALSGDALAAVYGAADVLVFPSRTDTFGNVMVEALACGTPVAAFPVAGPRDVLAGMNGGNPCGVMAEDLRNAALSALSISAGPCLDHAARFSWEVSADQFLSALVPMTPSSGAAMPMTGEAVR